METFLYLCSNFKTLFDNVQYRLLAFLDKRNGQENGKNLTISTIARLFKALNQKVSLDIPSIGRVALW